jgi:hypothetical protein
MKKSKFCRIDSSIALTNFQIFKLSNFCFSFAARAGGRRLLALAPFERAEIISSIASSLLTRQVLISPTFYVQLFGTKVSIEAILYLHFRFELFLVKEYLRK